MRVRELENGSRKSVMSIPIENIEPLYNKYHGTGDIFQTPNGSYREILDFHETIGLCRTKNQREK